MIVRCFSILSSFSILQTQHLHCKVELRWQWMTSFFSFSVWASSLRKSNLENELFCFPVFRVKIRNRLNFLKYLSRSCLRTFTFLPRCNSTAKPSSLTKSTVVQRTCSPVSLTNSYFVFEWHVDKRNNLLNHTQVPTSTSRFDILIATDCEENLIVDKNHGYQNWCSYVLWRRR